MVNLVFTHKELKQVRAKLLFLQLENEVILNELIEQKVILNELIEHKEEINNSIQISEKDSIQIAVLYKDMIKLNQKIREKKHILKEIDMELKNIQLINELNCFTVI